jgi:hypothetical protein
MRKESAVRGRRIGAAVAALALIGGVVGIANPAQAVTAVTEDFEGPFPYDRIGVAESQPRSLVWLGNHAGSVFRGKNVALLHGTNGVYAQIYSKIGVILDRPSPSPPSCNANVMLALTRQSLDNPVSRRATVYLRLWAGSARNVPPLVESIHTITHETPYELYQFGGFSFQPSTRLYFEISATNGIVLVDDVHIACVRTPS